MGSIAAYAARRRNDYRRICCDRLFAIASVYRLAEDVAAPKRKSGAEEIGLRQHILRDLLASEHPGKILRESSVSALP
jgi:hypothetical protein